jgi:hypothetical protein
MLDVEIKFRELREFGEFREFKEFRVNGDRHDFSLTPNLCWGCVDRGAEPLFVFFTLHVARCTMNDH